MTPDYSSKSNKFLALILGTVFICILTLILLTFLSPKSKTNFQTKTIKYPINKVWESIYDRSNYLKSKPEIEYFKILDSVCPSWIEYYTSKDSVENYCRKTIPNIAYSYSMINRKYEQVNGLAIRIDSLSPSSTKVSIAENSRFFNASANIYFQLFHPTTVIDYEFVKIANTLEFIDSLSTIQEIK